MRPARRFENWRRLACVAMQLVESGEGTTGDYEDMDYDDGVDGARTVNQLRFFTLKGGTAGRQNSRFLGNHIA